MLCRALIRKRLYKPSHTFPVLGKKMIQAALNSVMPHKDRICWRVENSSRILQNYHQILEPQPSFYWCMNCRRTNTITITENSIHDITLLNTFSIFTATFNQEYSQLLEGEGLYVTISLWTIISFQTVCKCEKSILTFPVVVKPIRTVKTLQYSKRV